MCDCYSAPCEVCGDLGYVDMHIGDFLFPREDFKVWCRDHIKDAPDGATVFVWEQWYKEGGGEDSCAIIGPDLYTLDGVGGGDNGPNAGSAFKRIWVKGEAE